ncbi:hypothetical protein TrCOL_g4924 [Triparma columacea]|uniref:Magnesium transporter n=1 Tax=Triparma columacea TaxID=722753 RepID=A0A9W7GDA7_9STRA|nr:hypothetical protein TrCOL_g4924 [Triparma columacea]
MSSEVNNGLAIPLALVGNAINSIGYIIQKQAHMMNEDKKEKWVSEQEAKVKGSSQSLIENGGKHGEVIRLSTTTPKVSEYPTTRCFCSTVPSNHFLVTPLWWVGIILYGVGSAIHGSALSYGSHTIIAPMDAFTLVCNAIFAPLFLHEHFTRPQILGTCILIAGIAGIAVSAPSDPPAFESGKCFDMMGQTRCLAVLGGWGGATLAMYLARRIKVESSLEKDTSKAKGVVEMICLCLICAFVGSLCQLSLKCFFSQLSFLPEVLTEGSNFYFITFFFIAMMLLLEVWRQRALKNYDALFVVPIICALLLSGSVVVGGICFNEFDVITSSEASILGVSVGFCVLGVVVTTYKAEDGDGGGFEEEGKMHPQDYQQRRRSMVEMLRLDRKMTAGGGKADIDWGERTQVVERELKETKI